MRESSHGRGDKQAGAVGNRAGGFAVRGVASPFGPGYKGETLSGVRDEERQRVAGRSSVDGPSPIRSGGRDHAEQPMCCPM